MPFKDPMDNPGHSRSPGLAASLAVFVAGLVVGLGMVAHLGGQFIAGLIIIAALCFVLSLLQRTAENTRKRVTAGEASYRAFFDHAIEGVVGSDVVEILTLLPLRERVQPGQGFRAHCIAQPVRC